MQRQVYTGINECVGLCMPATLVCSHHVCVLNISDGYQGVYMYEYTGGR